MAKINDVVKVLQSIEKTLAKHNKTSKPAPRQKSPQEEQFETDTFNKYGSGTGGSDIFKPLNQAGKLLGKGKGAGAEAGAAEGVELLPEGSAIAGEAAGAAGVAGAAAGPIGIAVVAIEKTLEWWAKMPGALEKFSNGLLNAQRPLAEFSGAMQGVFSRKEAFEAMQAMKIGEATAGSAGSLESSHERLSENMNDLMIPFTNLTNEVTAFLAETVGAALGTINDLMDMSGVNEGLAEIAKDIKALKEWWLGGGNRRDKEIGTAFGSLMLPWANRGNMIERRRAAQAEEAKQAAGGGGGGAF